MKTEKPVPSGFLFGHPCHRNMCEWNHLALLQDSGSGVFPDPWVMESGEQPGRNGKGLSLCWMSRSTHLCSFLSCQALLFFNGRVAIKLQFCSPISEAPRTKRRGTRSYVCTSQPGLSGLSASSMYMHRRSWSVVSRARVGKHKM